jgi:hypothetical protein
MHRTQREQTASRPQSFDVNSTAPDRLGATRSSSITSPRSCQSKASGTSKGDCSDRVPCKPRESNDISVIQTPWKHAHLQLYHTLTPRLQQKLHGNGVMIHSVWIQAHPLQRSPSAYTREYQAIQEREAIRKRRMDWEMDLLRLYDEKRMANLEAQLLSARRDKPASLSADQDHAGSLPASVRAGAEANAMIPPQAAPSSRYVP